MKKIFVSSVVMVAFISYSLYQRVYGGQPLPIISPKTVGSNYSVTPSSNPTPTVSDKTSTIIPTAKESSPTPQNTPTPTPKPNSLYKDGSFTGDAADAFYGNIQVQATISNGRITNVVFLQYPNDRGTSIYINSQADPILAQEAIQAQSANVNIVSGATDSSNAFVQSLQSALNKAKS